MAGRERLPGDTKAASMRLIEMLETEAGEAASLFRRVLAKEDLARLEKLRALAREHKTIEAFIKHGLFIGWTKDDLRTGEVKPELEDLMGAIFAFEQHPDDGAQTTVLEAWARFQARRMKVLVHCL